MRERHRALVASASCLGSRATRDCARAEHHHCTYEEEKLFICNKSPTQCLAWCASVCVHLVLATSISLNAHATGQLLFWKGVRDGWRDPGRGHAIQLPCGPPRACDRYPRERFPRKRLEECPRNQKQICSYLGPILAVHLGPIPATR